MKKIGLHQVVLFGAMVLLSVWRLLTGSFAFGLEMLWWWLGGVLGFLFVFCDRSIYSFLTRTDAPMSVRVKEIFEQDKLVDGLRMLFSERFEQKEMIMRSFLFLVTWAILAIFTVTSVDNMFARGLMLGIGLHLIFDLDYDYFLDKQRFDLWFWQIKRNLEEEEKKWFVGVFSAMALVLILGM